MSEQIGEACPIPIERLKGMDRYTAIAEIEKSQFPLIGTPEFKAMMEDFKELGKNSHIPRFKCAKYIDEEYEERSRQQS